MTHSVNIACAADVLYSTSMFDLHCLLASYCFDFSLRLRGWQCVVLRLWIFVSDRVDIVQKKELTAIHDRLVLALQSCLQKNHPDSKLLLAKVLMSLVSIRDLTARSNKALPKIQKDWSSACKIDPYWNEFIEDSHTWSQEH